MPEPLLDVTAAPRAGTATSRPGSVALVARPDLVVCDDCGAVHRRIGLAPGRVARCTRCNSLLGRGHVLRVQGLLAFAIAALLLMVIGNVTPIVTLDLNGVISRISLPEALAETWRAGEPTVAVFAGLTALGFPLALILLRLYILVPLASGHLPPAFASAMRVLRFVTHWSMVEVFMMGTLVAVVRTAGLAAATPGMGLFAYGALTLLLTSITAAGLHSLWKMGSDLGAG